MIMYYANFNVNNGTRLMESISGNNLNAVRNKIKSLASGEIFAHGNGSIVISRDGQDVEWLEAKWYGNKVRWFRHEG